MNLGKLHGAFSASVVVATIAVSAAALSQEAAPPPPPPAPAAAVAVPAAPPAAPKPVEEIVKLWKGNLSEEFIKRKIESEGVIYQLSADDIIACKAANVPEALIEAMMKTAIKQAPVAAPAVPPIVAAPPAAPAVAGAPAAPLPAPAVPAPSLAAQADRSWEGVVRRNTGVVVFKSRWDAGKLSFKDEKFTWLDADEEKKNLILPGKGIREQFLVCLKAASGEGECFEWGVKTEDGEYRFRDIGWERSDSGKPQELYEFMKAIYPNLVSVKYPADKK